MHQVISEKDRLKFVFTKKVNVKQLNKQGLMFFSNKNVFTDYEIDINWNKK